MSSKLMKFLLFYLQGINIHVLVLPVIDINQTRVHEIELPVTSGALQLASIIWFEMSLGLFGAEGTYF